MQQAHSVKFVLANVLFGVDGELSDESIDALARFLIDCDDSSGGSACTLCGVNQAVQFSVTIPGWDNPVDVCRSCTVDWARHRNGG